MDQVILFDGSVKITRRQRPQPEADEVLIRLRTAGICNTDLELIAGYKGFTGILGHEFVGDVIEGPDEWVGQRVVGEINISCGTCDMCGQDMPTQCRRRRTLGIQNYDGAWADVFRLPVRNLRRVPDTVPDEAAVFTEPLAAACQILEMAHIRPSDQVVLVGAGKLGLLAAQVLHLLGVDLSVVVRRERQTQLLAGWGIQAVSRSEIGNNYADVVIDCTGNASGFADALTLIRPRGTIVLKSTFTGLPEANLTRVVVDEIRVIGSRCGSFDTALNLLASRLVDVQSLIEARYSFAEIEAALQHAAKPGALKVLLTR